MPGWLGDPEAALCAVGGLLLGWAELLSRWLESRSVYDGELVWIIGLVGPWDLVEGTLVETRLRGFSR